MTKEERELIAQFMRLTMYQMHPRFSEYPIADMKQAEDSEGADFDNTPFADSVHLLQAYYMNQVIERLEKLGR